MSEEKKQELKEYLKNRYHNISEETKQELKNIINENIEKQKSLRVINKNTVFK